MGPIIAIPAQQTLGKEEDGHASACRQVYIDTILQAGGTPIIIPLGLSPHEWQKIYQISDGIFLSGGSDIDPTLYNEQPHPKLGKLIEERDRIESWLVKQAFKDNKPLLGICRGIQIINVALGGSLFQDLPDQFKSKIPHSSNGKNKWTELAHTIEIKADSKLAKILGTTHCAINSLHHQAVKELANQLTITANSPDGLIEAVEGLNKSFFIGVQWHPEALWQKINPQWLQLFTAFIEASKSPKI